MNEEYHGYSAVGAAKHVEGERRKAKEDGSSSCRIRVLQGSRRPTGEGVERERDGGQTRIT